MTLEFRRGGRSEPGWLPLDNAAKIFPSGTNRTRSLVFSLMAELSEPVRYEALLEAARVTSNRYPYFTMHLRKGFFWYWLEEVADGVPVLPDQGEYGKSFRIGWTRKPLCRILARGNRITAEFYHVLTDGTGGLNFFKTLLAAYCEFIGLKTPDSGFIHHASIPLEGETEDGYNRYFDPRLPAPPQLSKAYHLPFPFARNPRISITAIELSAEKIKEKARSRGISITEYLVSIYLMSLQQVIESTSRIGKIRSRPVIRIQVPVNLRSLFPSNTLRNFALFVMPEIDRRLGHYSFEEIIHTVHHFMQHQTDPKLMQKIIYRNVRNEKSIFIRMIPLLLKDPVLSYFFNRSGMALYSGLITNLGKIDFSGEMGDHIERMRFFPPPPDKSKVSMAAITYRDRLILTISNATTSHLVEKLFLGFLKEEQIPVTIINP